MRTAVHVPSGLLVEVLQINDKEKCALVMFPKGTEINIALDKLEMKEVQAT